jgi:hypothetical protein
MCDVSDCKIKGNISKAGKIYHVPGSKFYNKVKIDKAKVSVGFALLMKP